MNLHFLHGFLGLPNDWAPFENLFLNHTCFFHSIENDITDFKNEKNPFFQWAEKFNNRIFKNNLCTSPQILIAYSLGGRLAVHCLLDHHAQWDAAIIVSANPGLCSQEERTNRIQNDLDWAERFRTKNWENLMQVWNSQRVFSQENNFIRKEENFKRENLAYIIDKFSLGRQEDLRNKIKHLNIPILWCAGDLDTKFVQIANEMELLNPNIQKCIVHNAGHRVPWDCSPEFAKQCAQFLKKLPQVTPPS